MLARIYKPAKTAMQSGAAKTRLWVLDYEPEEPRVVESLMGWTSSGDMKSQVRLRFATKDEAVAYCEKHGLPYHSMSWGKVLWRSWAVLKDPPRTVDHLDRAA